MKIVSVDKVYLYSEHLKNLKKFGQVIVYNNVPSKNEGIKRIKDADIIIDNWFKMPANVIASAPKLKMISVAATGYEWIDMKEIKKRKIVVCNCPGYSTEAVAEHTIGLLLNSARLSSQSQQDIKSGQWNPATYKGKELFGKTLGIIGYGKIGKRVAEICQKGLEMKIIFINSKSSKKDLEKLLETSDFISVNAPINNQTKDLLGKKEFALMKQGIVIINTGRGAVINEQALIENLKSGKVFAAGLDVFPNEPLENKNYPLFSFPNVITTSHIGFHTQEAEYRLSQMATENIIKYLEGKPQNAVS